MGSSWWRIGGRARGLECWVMTVLLALPSSFSSRSIEEESLGLWIVWWLLGGSTDGKVTLSLERTWVS